MAGRQFEENFEEYQKCNACGKIKHKNDFYNITHNYNRNQTSYQCKECLKKSRQLGDSSEEVVRFMRIKYNDAKQRARRSNIFFDITFKDLVDLYNKQAGHCAITNRKLTCKRYNDKKYSRNLDNLSIDRIDSSKGYVVGNIHLVCCIVNIMKSELEFKEFLEYCQAVIDNNKNHKL